MIFLRLGPESSCCGTSAQISLQCILTLLWEPKVHPGTNFFHLEILVQHFLCSVSELTLHELWYKNAEDIIVYRKENLKNLFEKCFKKSMKIGKSVCGCWNKVLWRETIHYSVNAFNESVYCFCLNKKFFGGLLEAILYKTFHLLPGRWQQLWSQSIRCCA